MTWVKICGITNLEDALTAVDAGADALGFVFYEESPRNVMPETVGGIVATLPTAVEKVGVFAGELGDRIHGIAARAKLTGVQLHADCSRSGSDALFSQASAKSVQLFMALQVRRFLDDRGRFDSLALSTRDHRMKNVRALLLDSGTMERPGGTGLTFDWKKARPLADAIRQAGFNLIVAGGLTPSNVSEAMHVLEPWGVDVSSGVEASPGKKDSEKVRAFVAAVRQEDAKH